MDDRPDNIPSAFRFTDPRQDRIHRRLDLVGPGPAAFYRDICRLLTVHSVIEAMTHVVAHLLREIESAIRDVLLPHDYVAPKGKGRHRAEIEAILKAYGIEAADPVAVAWLRLADEGHDERLAPFAHRDSLGAPRRLDDDFRQFVAEVEGIFDVILQHFESRFLGSLPLVDELVKRTGPTRADVEILRGKVPNNLITLDYFFGKVQAPEWLELLAAAEFFERPPDPVRDEDKGITRFPPWPESRYLVRMAAKPELQARVVEIAAAIPETGNTIVHDDLMRIALTVPAALATKLVPDVKAAMQLPYQLRLIHRVGDLVSHLSRGGEGDAALELTEMFLTILPDPDAREVTVGGETVRMLPHPRTPYDEWVLGEFLKNNLPDVVVAVGVGALRIVCKALDDAVRLSRSRPDDEGPDDYSTLWHPAIDQDRDVGHDLKPTLVAAVRRTAEQLVQQDSARLDEAIETLEAHQWRVFDRIALHVLRGAPASALPLIEARLGNQEKFRERRLKREYVLLAQSAFPQLRPETQERILGWIEEGPELDGYKQTRTETQGTPPSAEELAEYVDRWRLEYLRSLRDVLPGGWRARYEALVAKYGEPEAPDFLAIRMHAVTRGPGSPIPGTELCQMSVPDIISRLKTWEPSGEFMGPSPEGLSRELSGVVADNPSRFAEEVEKFQDVEPTYVRGVLSGFRDALGKDRVFSWVPVLKLCQWVVDQPFEPGDRGGAWERDRGWGWTRKAIADLLEDGLQPGPTQIPFELRQEVWKVLLLLTNDPDPMPNDETDEEGSEPEAVSINTTRGKAMHALVRYALWVKEHLERASEGSIKWKASLDDMPEVREVLETHLDPARDPSLAIRSAYGRWLPWLIFIDPQWVTENRAKILPTVDALARFRDAAWDTYVVFSQVYNDAGDFLKEEYVRAAARLGKVGPKKRDPTAPANHLAEHLMILYCRGKVERHGPELTQFYAHAPDKVCGHAMWVVGRIIAREEEEPPAEMIDRLKELFEGRMETLRADPQKHRKELEQFGSWFASGRFGEEWSLAKLQEVLSLAGGAEPDSLVMDQLVKWAPPRPIEVLECVRLMVEGADEYWKIQAWRDDIRRMVSIGLQAGGAARNAATALVNILAARGHLEFRDLLES